MITETSGGAIIFRRENSRILYLLLDYKSRFDLVKGDVLPGETEKETAVREIDEETGIIDITFVDNFMETLEYSYRWENDLLYKKITFFLVETGTKDIKISFEHFGYKWCEFGEAMKLLKFRNTREILKKADELLNSKA